MGTPDIEAKAVGSAGQGDEAPEAGPVGDAAGSLGDTLWDALCEDTGAMVMVLDPSGRIVRMNSIVRDALGDGAEPTSLADITPSDIADERTEVAQRVSSSGTPACLVGMCGGVMRRTTFRRLPQTRGCVLVICRTLAADDAAERERAVSGVYPTRPKAEDHGALATLTPREREVLMLIGLGKTTQQIASYLDRSVKTVEWHRLSLGNKLGAANRVELARIAIRSGVSPLMGRYLDFDCCAPSSG